MGWSDFYRRRDMIDEVLRRARHDPRGPLPFEEIPGITEVFTGRDELLLALYYRWNLKLAGRLGVVEAETERDAAVDPVDAVSTTWRFTATEHQVLRSVLDAAIERDPNVVAGARDSEYRMLALAAGLAALDEDRDEITRIGAAYLALVRSTPERTGRRRHPVEQLLRRLVATA